MALWLSAPSIFLVVYVTSFSAPYAAVVPHLRLMLLGWLCLVLARVLIANLIPSAPAARVAATALVSAALAVMLSYYAAVLVGLQSWGRVISWEMITSYAGQIPDLTKTLEISLPIAVTAIGFTYLALLIVVRLYIVRLDWSTLIVRKLPGRWQAVIVLSLSVFSAVESYRFVDSPPNLAAEPISLTFFGDPADEVLRLQAKRLDVAKFDPEDDSIRSTYAHNPQADRKNIVLIVVDALRADHLGLNGYARDTTPYLSQLSRDKNIRRTMVMRSTCAESMCGLWSLATSKFAHQVSDNAFTLQEVLKRHGYQIHMLLGGDHTHFYGLKERYGKVDSYFDGSMARGEYANDDQLVIDRVKALAPWNNIPTMFQFHLMSAHLLGKRFQTPGRFEPAANYNPLQIRLHGHQDNFRELAINYYDNGVLQTDAVIGQLLRHLDAKGYLSNSIVVITADHGESLGERGLYNHAFGVHEAVLRIPFVMISFGFTPQPFSEKHTNASQVDIGPTLLHELKMPQPATWTGIPLQESDARQFSYFQQGQDAGLIDLRDPKNIWKYWINKKTGLEQAFNLSVDPAEAIDRIDAMQTIAQRDWKPKLPLTPLPR